MTKDPLKHIFVLSVYFEIRQSLPLSLFIHTSYLTSPVLIFLCFTAFNEPT